MRNIRLSLSALPLARVGVRALAVAWLLVFAIPVRAQTGGQSAQPAEDESEALQEVIVTARRREESIQDTPVAVSAFSGEALRERQIRDTKDLERITPSLQFKPAGQLSGNTAGSVVFIR
ncbi:MAG: hypothetical protein WB812_13920, partial [Woeseiaceae bacterium]